MTTPPAQQDVPQAIAQAFSLAVAHHQAGRVQQADELYRSILQLDPRHAPSNHNLGMLAMQAQQPELALGYFNAALDADPAEGQYWLSYIDALARAGQEEIARQVLDMAEQQGLQGEGVEALRAKLGLKEKKVAAQAPRAQTAAAPAAEELAQLEDLYKKARYAEVVMRAESLTLRFPKHWAAWKMLGVVLSQLGRHADALAPMQKAVELLPKDAESHNNLGITLNDLGRYAEAAASFRQAVKLMPGFAPLHSNLGAALQRMGRFKEAEASCRQALKLDPRNADALGNLGGILNDMGRAREGENVCRKALTIDPDNYAANSNLGLALKAQGQLDEAEMCFLRALSLRPDLVETHSNLGGVLHEQGRLAEAAESFRRVLEANPDDAVTWSNLLFCLSQDPDVPAQQLFEEHRRFAERIEAPWRKQAPTHQNTREAGRTLRIGFISGDLRTHVVMSYFEPVLQGLSKRPGLTLHAYHNHVVEDEVSRRVRGHFAHWHPVVALDDEALANRIRADGIDILIDLSGHTAKNRLPVFARKPAPLQASWIGYPCTTGLQAMDYYLTDRGLVPRGPLERQFSEQVVHLPASVPFLPSPDAPEVGELPALKNGYLTFGSFNRLSKINEDTVALWAQLLAQAPGSKMMLAGLPKAGGETQLAEWFARHGIARERLVFQPRCSMKDYLALHGQVDISLDTFPYSGGTTTLHALWMGVPTLTLAGDSPAARSGASILGNVGLTQCIADDREQFVQQGLALMNDLPALAALRGGARQRMQDSAMLQPALLAAALDLALRTMWRRWCAGEPAQAFEVTEAQAKQEEAAT
jgi:predicted O-linked N-acetylglucosamine transferase (SPINDLY family)